MFVKVRAAFVTAAIFAVAAGIAALASFDWADALGPWAFPVGAGFAWLAAYWKKEHPEVDGGA